MEENKKVMCAECGEEINLDDAIEYNGEYYCQDSFDKLFVECDCCGEIVRRADTKTTYDGDLICEDCFNDYYFVCADCGEILSRDEEYWISDCDKYICQDCYDNGDYFYCEDCCNYYSTDCEHYIEDCEYSVCEDCFDRGNYFICEDCGGYFSDDRERYIENYGYVCEDCFYNGDYYYDDDDCCYYQGRSIIGDYHSHGNCYEVFGQDDRERRLGIELEVENVSRTKDCENMAEELEEILNSHAYFEHDGSLDYGFEIITEPHTVDAFNEINWKKVLGKLSSNGYRSHDTGTCGLHIHVSRKWFGESDEERAINIAKLFICYSNNWGFFLKMSRRTQEQADHWASRYCTDEDFETVKEVAKSRYDSRYRAVNNTNRNTVEFRLGRGTLNYKSFMAWIDIHLALAKNAELISEEEASDLKLWLNGISDDTKEYIKSRSYKMYIELFGGAR